MRNILIMASIFILSAGCSTIETITFQNDYAKYINKMVILGPAQSKPIRTNITGDANIFYLMMGPAIIPQIMLAYATYEANKEESLYLNDLIFDFNIEKILREKFKDELETNTYFDPSLQGEISDNPEIKDILSKYPKNHNDYIKIASISGADTIIELSIYSYGLKDPGIMWDPNVTLTTDVKMIRVKDNKTLWQTRITEDTKRKSTGLDYIFYEENNAELLRYELEAAAEIVAKALVQDMGFKTKDSIKDIRDIVSERAAKTLEGYKDLRQNSYPADSSGARSRISPQNLDSITKSSVLQPSN